MRAELRKSGCSYKDTWDARLVGLGPTIHIYIYICVHLYYSITAKGITRYIITVEKTFWAIVVVVYIFTNNKNSNHSMMAGSREETDKLLAAAKQCISNSCVDLMTTT